MDKLDKLKNDLTTLCDEFKNCENKNDNDDKSIRTILYGFIILAGLYMFYRLLIKDKKKKPVINNYYMYQNRFPRYNHANLYRQELPEYRILPNNYLDY